MRNAKLVGKWAVCGRGHLGKIERWSNTHGGVWVGHKVDGSPWQSAKPVVLADQEFMREAYSVLKSSFFRT